MRIIAGRLKGREYKSPHANRTHPMSDKVKGALFNVLGDIEGLTVLDAFAGSGGLAFEAASRGAKNVTAIDKDGPVHKVIEQNVEELGLEKQVKVSRANAGGWSIHNMERKFDIVILAPPYDHLQKTLLHTLAKRHVKPGGILVLDWPGKQQAPEFDAHEKVADKNYGDAQLIFYRKVK
ncbi:MAG: RsmD family RNA methyltransferase [Candidatus Saccharimonadales bacterium]